MPPRRRKSTDYTRRRQPGAEGEEQERQISPQERRRQIMIQVGVWFLVLVFAMTSGVMCFNIGSNEQASQQVQQQAQDPIQAEIDRWTSQVGANPNDPVALANLGHYWARKAATLPTREEAAAASPTPAAASPSPGAPSPAATPQMSQEEAVARAEEYLQRALEKDPSYAFALQQLAEVRMMQKKPAEARALLEKILALAAAPIPEGEDPATIEANRATQTNRARMGLASVEAREKNYDKALEILAQVVKEQPGNVEAYMMRAGVLHEQDRMPEALQALDDAARVAEGMQNYGQALGARVEKSRIYQEQGDKDAARQELEKAKAVAEKTGNVQALMLLTQLLYAMDGNLPSAPPEGLPTGPSPVAPATTSAPVEAPVAPATTGMPTGPAPEGALPPDGTGPTTVPTP